jgi:hypothetical protein
MTQPGALFINAKYHWVSFMLSAFSPKAVINGQLVPLRWGDNHLPAPRGSHAIEIYVPYLWKFGRASIVVDNSTGVPPVYYAAPVWTWMRGAIGFQPQRTPGLTSAIIFYALFVFGLLACCGFAVFSANGS